MTSLIVLRLIHILCGIFWVGTLLYNTFFLMPVLGEMGPAAGAVMGGLQRRKFMVVMPVVALLTILSGLGMMSILSGGDFASYARSGMGQTISIAGGFALLALILGLIVVRPAMTTAARLGQEMAQVPEGPARQEMAAQLADARRRGATMSAIVTWLVVIAAAGMAVARYL